MAVPVGAILPSFNSLDRGSIMPPSQQVLAATTEFRVYDQTRDLQAVQYVLIQNLGAGTLDVVFNTPADGTQRHFQLTASTGTMPVIALPVGSWLVKMISVWSTAGTTFTFTLVKS